MYHKRPFLSTTLILNNDMPRFLDNWSFRVDALRKSGKCRIRCGLFTQNMIKYLKLLFLFGWIPMFISLYHEVHL